MPTTATPSRRLLEELLAPTLESRLEEQGVVRSFSRPRVSNDNPYTESLFRTAKYRPDDPRQPFASTQEACLWVASFVDWYNQHHRHSGFKFVTLQQRHSGKALGIFRHPTVVYEQARQRHPRRGRDPSVVGLNQKWSESIQHPQKTNRCRIRLPWLPERQQGRHPSWQSPQGLWMRHTDGYQLEDHTLVIQGGVSEKQRAPSGA
jgi:hypothetical protein